MNTRHVCNGCCYGLIRSAGFETYCTKFVKPVRGPLYVCGYQRPAVPEKQPRPQRTKRPAGPALGADPFAPGGPIA